MQICFVSLLLESVSACVKNAVVPEGQGHLSQNTLVFAIPLPKPGLAAQFFCLLQWNHHSSETLFAWRFL